MAENIPASGSAIIMMNHMGFLDPLVIMGAVTPRFVVGMSKIENYELPVLNKLVGMWGSYPVERGEVDRRALDFTIKLLNEGVVVLMAPEGTRQPALIEAKDGLTYLALKTGALIVPVGIEGTREFTTNLKHLRRTHINVNFGRAFHFRTGGRTRIPRPEMTRMTHEAMYQLAALIPDRLRGHYADLSQSSTDTLDFMS